MTDNDVDVDVEENLVEVDIQNMSRGDKPEALFNFPKMSNMYVYDEMGNKVKFGDIYKKQKTIIVFVRHFLCFICKDYVEDLALVPLEYLQEADVRIVIIGPAPFKFIKEFKKLTGCLYTMYCDPDRNLYKALGCLEKKDFGDLSKSKHVKSSAMMGMIQSTWRAMKGKEFQGEISQQGASLIIGPGDVLHYSHIDQEAIDHTPINSLLHIAGVQQVSFPGDPRVQVV
ncbi:hypothetical protein ScPMuIL_005483 [Solemya velum]